MSLDQVQGFAVDLDGVMWEGSRLLPGAREFLQWCEQSNKPVVFLTNTVSLSRAQIIGKFRRLGVTEATTDQIFSAGRAAAVYIAERKPGARVFVLGQPGTHEEAAGAGLNVVERDADYVLLGMDREIQFDRLKQACREALNGAGLVAANEDRWFPEEDGPVPGAGCFKAYVEWCCNRQAHVCGKPNVDIFLQALARLRLPAGRVAMIGDIPEVDLVGARKAGMKCILIGGEGDADWRFASTGAFYAALSKQSFEQ